jgi:hypothetical protein
VTPTRAEVRGWTAAPSLASRATKWCHDLGSQEQRHGSLRLAVRPSPKPAKRRREVPPWADRGKRAQPINTFGRHLCVSPTSEAVGPSTVNSRSVAPRTPTSAGSARSRDSSSRGGSAPIAWTAANRCGASIGSRRSGLPPATPASGEPRDSGGASREPRGARARRPSVLLAARGRGAA